LKLIDFGFARLLDSSVSGMLGTDAYCALELFTSQHCCPYLADMHSLGQTLFAIIFGS